MNRSRSLVVRRMPVKHACAKAPPTRKGTCASTSARSARRKNAAVRDGTSSSRDGARGAHDMRFQPFQKKALDEGKRAGQAHAMDEKPHRASAFAYRLRRERTMAGVGAARQDGQHFLSDRRLMPNVKRLPGLAALPSAGRVRFAAVGDLHVTKDSAGSLRGFFAQASEAADALLLCGDLTDYGTAEEAHVLAEELGAVSVPIVAVLGNHDYQSGTPEIVRETLMHAGVRVLDGEACEIEGVGIAGVKGFAGGFGRGSLGAWGEPAIKLFVQEALNEAMKLESALAKLRTPRRIALLHYSPIAG